MSSSGLGFFISVMLAMSGSPVPSPSGEPPTEPDVEVLLGEPPTRPSYGLDEPRAPRRLSPPSAISVDNQNRAAVVTLFDTVFTPAFSVPMSWTGSIAGCVPGTTSQAYIDATMDLINYYRAMTGLPGDVVNVASLVDDSQEAALMMIAEGALSHTPGMSWSCYTPNGAAAAAASNLALGNGGPDAIEAYIRDSGATNKDVGHRRWILYPLQVQMATGSTDGVNGFFHGSNDLYVFAGFGSRPGSPSIVAWPPGGYVPYQIVYPRWSFSLNSAPNADYSAATVTMMKGGVNVPLAVVSRTAGYGDQTIVWEPSGLSFGMGQPDQTVSVTVSNIAGASSTSYTYDVIVIDPAAVVPDEADLSVSIGDSDDPVPAGAGLLYTVTVSNAGPITAQNVELASSLSTGVTFSTTAGCANDPNGVSTCDLGALASGASAEVVVAVAVDSSTSGTIMSDVSVSTTTVDPAAGNDVDSETTLVYSPTNCSNNNLSLDALDSTSNDTLMAENTLSAGSGFAAQSGGTVHFRAGSQIALTNNFTVETGASFEAFLDPLLNCN